MPTAVTNNSLPHAAAAIVIVAIHEALVRHRPAVLRSSQHINRLTRLRAIEVPDIHFAVVGAGVNIATVGGAGRREVAADERFEDAVAAEGDEGAVVGVRPVVFGVVGAEAVVEVCGVVLCK